MRFNAAAVTGVTAIFALLSLSQIAHAQAPPTVTTPPAGDVLLQELTSAYTATSGSGSQTQTVAGNLYSAVFSTTSGTRDFFYQFTVTGTSTAPVTQLGVSDFTPYSTTLGQSTATDIDGAGNPFTTGGTIATGSSVLSGTVFFSFIAGSGTGVAVGGQSSTLLVRTNATAFANGVGSLASAASSNAAILAPAGTAAPEPGALALVIPGLLGVVGLVRRRKSA